MSQTKHKQLEYKIKSVIVNLDLTHFPAHRWRFPFFKPDIVIQVGATQKNLVAIDAIASKRALNRVLGGLYRTITHDEDRQIRHCVAVVHPDIESEIDDLYRRKTPRIEEMDDNIVILKLSELELWLKKEIIQCAEETIKELSDKFYHLIRKK